MRKTTLVIIFLLGLAILGPLSSLSINTIQPTGGYAPASFSSVNFNNLKVPMLTAASVLSYNGLKVQTSSTSSSSSHHLGFWLQETDVLSRYTPSQFFHQYFLTSPYPSSLEAMVFGPQIGAKAEQGSINYWTAVASQADSYPNIKMEMMIAFNMNTQMADFRSYVNAFKSHPSIYSIGIEGEYSTNKNLANMQTAMNIVTASGKQFVNYYVGASIVPRGGYIIGHTNFPGGDGGGYDQVGTLGSHTSSPYIGIDSGYYGNFQFPSSVKCTIGSSIMNRGTSGWNQCVVNTEISMALAQPSQNRQFVNLVAGFPSPRFSTFKDTAGISTSQLWDNPTLRSWIWANTQYQSNFVLSTSNPKPNHSQPPKSLTCSISTSRPLVGSWLRVTCNGLPPSSKLRVIISNSKSNIVAILFRGPTGSEGRLSFTFHVSYSMIGSDSISIYSRANPNAPLVSGLQIIVP